jgi:hypothetical protein
VQWEWLISVLFVLALIVNSFLRRNDEERRTSRPRLPGEPDRPPVERTPRRTGTDIDRFLEEVNRRRRQSAEQHTEAGKREPPTVIPQAKPVPAKPRPRPTKPAGGTPSRPAPALRPAPERRVSEPVVVAEVVPVSPQPKVMAKVEHVVGRLAAPAPPPTRTAAPPTDLVGLVALLRSPQSLRTAIMLREIFDSPRCRRYGRR